MWSRIIAFFMSVIAFFSSLFGGGGGSKPAAVYKEYLNQPYGSDSGQTYDLYPRATNPRIGRRSKTLRQTTAMRQPPSTTVFFHRTLRWMISLPT